MDHHRCIITGHTLHVTASFGLAMHQGGESPGALLARTDKALYQAKNTGRNQVIADDSLKPASVDT
jgi:PleD family two-component response regulator